MNFRIYLLFFISLVCVVLTGVINVIYGIDIVYTHLFYIPIILSGVWYPRYAVFLAVALGVLHVASDYASVEAFKVGPFLRAAMFMVVAYVTSQLVLRQDRLSNELQKRNNELADMSNALHDNNKALQTALNEVKTLKGILPICASCKKIRDDKGYWNQIESYIHDHSEAEFSHGICPECVKKMYPKLKHTNN
jgi:hypothetical protein